MLKASRMTFFFILGFISLILGIVGLVLPVLPTTPFIILAAFLFNKSSQRVHSWLTSIPAIGSVIIKWEKEKIITVKTKILALTMLWLMMGLTLYFSGIQIWLKMIIGICGVGISLYLLSFPSTKKQDV